MKTLHISLMSLLVSTSAFAGSPAEMLMVDHAPSHVGFGGLAAVNYGFAIANDEGNYGDDESFTYYGIDGSVGSAGNGGFGWQIDANYEVGTLTDGDEYYNSYGLTGHANFGVGNYTLGVFVGGGLGDNVDDDDVAEMYWYGVDAARTFGDFSIAAHAGLASSTNSHDSLDFDNRLFIGAQARYFVHDDLMITATLDRSLGTIHSADLLQSDYSIEGTMRLANTNFYGSVLLGQSFMNADYNGGSEGAGAEQHLALGITYVFGGGNLRDTYTGSTPMMTNNNLTRMGVNTSTYD